GAVEYRRVLRSVVLREPARSDHRAGIARQGRAGGGGARSRDDRGSPSHLAVLSRPPPRRVRRPDRRQVRSLPMRTLIKNGTVVTASDTFVADVWIDNGKIAALGTIPNGTADKTIDATGKYVIP